MRWGQGSLQEIDHVPFVRPVTKFAATPDATAEIPGLVDEALATALRPHSGPAFVDFPLDYVFMEAAGAEDGLDAARPAATSPSAEGVERGAGAAARRRAAGDHGRHEPLLGPRRGRAARARRGAAASRCSSTAWRAAACPPTTSCSSRARAATALKGADVALVIGVPMDFRLGFGDVVRRGDRDRRARPRRADARPPARRSPPSSTAASTATLDALLVGARAATRPTRGSRELRAAETEKRAAEAGRADRRPRAAAPDAALQGAGRGARPRRDRHRRRRRLRLLRRPRHRLLRAGLLAGPGPVRLPGRRAGLRAGGQARAPRPAGRAAARRRRVRLQRAWSSTRSPATASTSSA